MEPLHIHEKPLKTNEKSINMNEHESKSMEINKNVLKIDSRRTGRPDSHIYGK